MTTGWDRQVERLPGEESATNAPTGPIGILTLRRRFLERLAKSGGIYNESVRRHTIRELIDRLPVLDATHSFGDDIDRAHKEAFHPAASSAERENVILAWMGKYLPCLFGRMGSRGTVGFALTTCWISSADIDWGESYLLQKIQRARIDWKNLALEGKSSAFLIIFNDERLAYAKPSHEFLNVSLRLAQLYLPEFAPLAKDHIYSEAIPLEIGGDYSLFRAGVNIFYPSAHMTRNHDRRVPGGMIISVNSPGHLAHSLVRQGHRATFDEAVQETRSLALLSVGRGGVGHPIPASSSWHNTDVFAPSNGCPVRKKLRVRDGVALDYYSADYHTDVLAPSIATLAPYDAPIDVWNRLVIDYPDTAPVEAGHPNYGLYHGHPIAAVDRYSNPWNRVMAINSPGALD